MQYCGICSIIKSYNEDHLKNVNEKAIHSFQKKT